MTDMKAPWMHVARALNGEAELKGSLANPRIVEMFRVTGVPDDPAFRSDETAWCAAFVNSCLRCSGFDGTKSALASSFLNFGADLGRTAAPGCVVLFHPLSAGASGHVGFYLGEDANSIKVLGGNQHDRVKEQSFSKSKWRAYRWPSQTTPLPESTTLPTILTLFPSDAPDHLHAPKTQTPAVALIKPVPADNFVRVQPIIDQWEGGFSDHPQDPGGATNMGITQATLAAWRGTNVTKSDVKALQRDEAWQIFRAKYWSPLRCDEMPIGLAIMTYNAGVNSGIGRGARWLQQALNKQGLNLDVDGEVGPNTLSAGAHSDVDRAIADFAGIQEAFLRGLSTFPTFGKGWMNRLTDVKSKALALASEPVAIVAQAEPDVVKPTTDPLIETVTSIIKETSMVTTPSTATTQSSQRLADIVAILTRLAPLLSGQTQPQTAGGQPAGAPQIPLSSIDKLLGGELLAGKKTLVAVIAYVGLAILQSQGTVGTAAGIGGAITPTGQILTTLIAGFGALGGASKIDRLIKVLSMVAGARVVNPAPAAPPVNMP